MDELRAALHSLVQQACRALSTIEFPVRVWTRVVREGPGRMSFPQEPRPDIGEALAWLRISRGAMPSPDQVVTAIRSNPSFSEALVDAGGNPIARESQPWWIENFVIAPFLYKYFTVVGSPAFDEQAFGQVFAGLAQAFETPTIVTVVELTPLLNVELGVSEINVGCGLRIRQLSTNEIEGWVNPHPLFPFTSMATMDLLRYQCAIEASYQQPRRDPIGSRSDVPEMVKSLVSALRLLSDRNVFIGFTESTSPDFLTSGGGRSWQPSIRRTAEPAELDAEQGARLIGIWDRLRNGSNAELANLALRRWDDATERLREDDKLIDYWIALESLFAPDSSQEVRYRASLRVAAFLGQTPDERGTIYSEIRKSYDTRSDIVHGNVNSFNQNRKQRFEAELASISRQTRSYLRRALLAILNSDEPFDPTATETQLLRK